MKSTFHPPPPSVTLDRNAYPDAHYLYLGLFLQIAALFIIFVPARYLTFV
jgi:hypothetical protein